MTNLGPDTVKKKSKETAILEKKKKNTHNCEDPVLLYAKTTPPHFIEDNINCAEKESFNFLFFLDEKKIFISILR